MSYNKNFESMMGNYLVEEEDIEIPKDITEDFFQFIYENRDNNRFGFVIRIDGSKGAGKSTLANILGYNIVISNLQKRNLCYWTSSDNLVPAHIEAAPQNLKGKIKKVEKLADIKNWDVVIVDEGVDIADAKEALTVESRNMGKALTILRHKAIIFIICSVRSKGILSFIRDDADIVFYKMCNKQYIKNSDNLFVKVNEDVLLNLSVEQALIDSDYKLFRKSGGIEVRLKDFCPWLVDFDDKISLNMVDVSLDLEGSRTLKREALISQVARMAIDKYGMRLIKPKSANLIRAWLKKEHPEYIHLKKYISEIIDDAIYYIEEEKSNKENQKQENLTKEIVIPKLNVKEDDSCAIFFRDFYKQNGQDKLVQDIIYHMIKNAMGLKETSRYYGDQIKYNRLRNILEQYQTGKNLDNPDLRLGYVYEMYCAKKTGGERAGGIGEPDIFYRDENGEIIGIGECKFYLIQKESSKEFYQTIPGKHNGKLNSGYNYCIDKGLEKYILFFRVVPWINADLCFLINVNDSNRLLAFKDDLSELIDNFCKFNYKKYFKNNNKKRGKQKI